MTLFRQLMALLLINCMLLTAGEFGISMLNARYYLQSQLQISAHNTAHMLALELPPIMNHHDRLKAQVMIQAVFDQGYYRRILLSDINGRIVYEDHRNFPRISMVPTWFRRLWPMSAQAEHVSLTRGWLVVGSLIVEANSDYAYVSLWHQASNDAVLVLLVYMIMAVIGYLALRVVTQPLNIMEEAADAVLRREFRLIEPLPRTREFRRVVSAMNRLTGNIHQLVEELVQQLKDQHNSTFQDELTGIANRKAFERDYQSWVQADESTGSCALILLELNALSELNVRLGSERADQLLVHVASRLRTLQNEHRDMVIARLQGGRFAVLLPQCERSVAQAVLEYLTSALRLLLVQAQQDGLDLRFYAGMAYMAMHKAEGDLLKTANQALSQAHSSSSSVACVLETSAQYPAFFAGMGNDLAAIRERLDALLQSKDVRLYYLPCLDAQRHVLHKEVLLRLNVDGQILPAASFIPLIEQFGWAWRLDFLVLDLILQYQNDVANLGKKPDCLHINLSPYSLSTADFYAQLLLHLEESELLLPHVRFEVNELAWVMAPEAVKNLAVWLNAHGSALIVDRFAWRQAGLELLSTLPLQAIKLDVVYALTDDVHGALKRSTLLHMLLQLMHSMDIQVMVDNIRSEEQWERLLSLGVDGGQGFWFGEPHELETLSWSDV